MTLTLTLTPGATKLKDLERVFREDIRFELDERAFEAVNRSATRLADSLQGDVPIYGVNTGFGKLASVRIDNDKLLELQRNLVRSHCAGYGDPLPAAVVRLIAALKCLSLGRG